MGERRDTITQGSIRQFMNIGELPFDIRVFDTIDSTNAEVKRLAARGAREGLVVVASSQTAGRGRRGRSFFSPEGTGLYMSLLLRPALSPAQATRITTMAAVGICTAIERLSGRKPGIKWVNDVLLDGRKVCGILTEAAMSADGASLDYVVLGIGINVLAPETGFPPEIASIAGSVFIGSPPNARSLLCAAVLDELAKDYLRLPEESFAEEYRRRCIVPGRRITVLRGDSTLEADALSVDDECRLLVRYDDGREELLGSGEISIRL